MRTNKAPQTAIKLSLSKVNSSTPKPATKNPNTKPGDPKVLKSAQATTDAENTNPENQDDGEVAEGEEETWEPGKPISEGADEVAAKTTKDLQTLYYDYKRSELEIQRGMQQDQLAFQKTQQELSMKQQNTAMGASLAMGLINPLMGAFQQMGRSQGGTASAGGTSSATDGEKTGESAEENKKPFEDENKIQRVDSKGNPITEDGKPIPQKGQSSETSTEEPASRSTSYSETAFSTVDASEYDSDNGMSIAAIEPRGNSDAISFDLDVSEEAENIAEEAQDSLDEILEEGGLV